MNIELNLTKPFQIMRKLVFTFLLLLPILSVAQVEIDSEGFETFTMQEGDTTFVMKKYFLVLLKSGENRAQNTEEAQQIQRGHMAHMDSLAALGQLDIAGPMGDEGELRGIVVLRVPTMERAQACTDADPAIQSKRLIAEIHPWWAAIGSTLR